MTTPRQAPILFAAELPASESLGRWTKLVPAGRFSARDGRGPFDAGNLASMQAIIDRTRRYHGSTDIVVDYDHQSVFAARDGVGGTAPAAGWVKDLEARNDGIYGRIEWTPAARAAITAGEYRYLSPVLPKRGADGRISMILNVALTNSPALDMEAVAASARHHMLNPERSPTMDYASAEKISEAAAALGLPPELPADAVLEKLRTAAALAADILGSAAPALRPDPAEYVPMSVFQETAAELNRLRQGVTRETAERHVSEQIKAGRIMPFMRDWAVDLCTTNMKAFDAFCVQLGPSVAQMVAPQLGERRWPRTESDGALTDSEEAVRATLGLTVEEFREAAR